MDDNLSNKEIENMILGTRDFVMPHAEEDQRWRVNNEYCNAHRKIFMEAYRDLAMKYELSGAQRRRLDVHPNYVHAMRETFFASLGFSRDAWERVEELIPDILNG